MKDTDDIYRITSADEAHVEVADVAHEAALDEALDLQLVSIRVPKQLIEQYELIARAHGVDYKTLMRYVLAKFGSGWGTDHS